MPAVMQAAAEYTGRSSAEGRAEPSDGFAGWRFYDSGIFMIQAFSPPAVCPKGGT